MKKLKCKIITLFGLLTILCSGPLLAQENQSTNTLDANPATINVASDDNYSANINNELNLYRPNSPHVEDNNFGIVNGRTDFYSLPPAVLNMAMAIVRMKVKLPDGRQRYCLATVSTYDNNMYTAGHCLYDDTNPRPNRATVSEIDVALFNPAVPEFSLYTTGMFHINYGLFHKPKPESGAVQLHADWGYVTFTKNSTFRAISVISAKDMIKKISQLPASYIIRKAGLRYLNESIGLQLYYFGAQPPAGQENNPVLQFWTFTIARQNAVVLLDDFSLGLVNIIPNRTGDTQTGDSGGLVVLYDPRIRKAMMVGAVSGFYRYTQIEMVRTTWSN